MVRKAGNRGSFYPYSCDELRSLLKNFNSELDNRNMRKDTLKRKPRAIIVPHSGFIYSGFTANIAHKLIRNSKPKRVIVIGPSHHLDFNGISLAINDYYETPCGNILIDKKYSRLLKEKFDTLTISRVHYLEYSTETQMPFIRLYEPNSKIVEIVYNLPDSEYKTLSKMISFLLRDESNVVVVSSDLSSFYSIEEAKIIDNICLAGVLKKSSSLLDKGCEACGVVGIKALLDVAREEEFGVELLDYSSSADVNGDKKRVVGYMSAVLFKE
jgi:AmmeMemoRadiSam system protein B